MPPASPTTPAIPHTAASPLVVQDWWRALHVGDVPTVFQRLREDPGWAQRWDKPAAQGGAPALPRVLMALPYVGGAGVRHALVEALIPHSDVRWDQSRPGNVPALIPLILAAALDQVEILNLILPHSDPKATNHLGETALMRAALLGNETGIEALLPWSDPHAVDATGMTAAMWAARYGRLTSLGMLLPDARLEQRNEDGNTLLLLAARTGLHPVLDRWLADPAVDFTVRNHDGEGVVDAWTSWTSTRASGSHPFRFEVTARLQARVQAQERQRLLDGLDLDALPTGRPTRVRM